MRTERVKWTDMRVETLERLWAKGLSGGEIARHLGGVTRNAVIGKANRLNLDGHPRPPAGPRAPRKRKPSKPVTSPLPVTRSDNGYGGGIAANLRRKTGKAFAKPAEPVRAKPQKVSKPGKLVRLMDLTPFDEEPGQCRWPIGDTCGPDTLFCGAAKEAPHLPYCGHHARVATGKAQPAWTPETRAAVALGRARAATARS